MQLSIILSSQSFSSIYHSNLKGEYCLNLSNKDDSNPLSDRVIRSYGSPQPASQSQLTKSRLVSQFKPIILSSFYAVYSLMGIRPAVASASEYEELGFTLSIPDGWTILPRKLPSPSFSQYMSEEILLVASNFVEGVSLSVTKSNAQRLLKDFNIDWWFDTISTIEDVGNADLISKLLILQRQGNFEGKIPSAASLLSSSLDNNHILTFTFDMPVAEGVARKTLVKSFFQNGYLYSLWISGLDAVFDDEYAAVVRDIQSSFGRKS